MAAGGRTLNRRGRNRLHIIPVVTNGETEVMVDTMEHAVECRDCSTGVEWTTSSRFRT